MAADDKSTESSEIKKSKKSYAHCKKDVASEVKCKKCKFVFHPACLKQSGEQKRAICAHIEDVNIDLTSKSADNETEYLKKMFKEMSFKINKLEENEMLLMQKVSCLEEKINILEKRLTKNVDKCAAAEPTKAKQKTRALRGGSCGDNAGRVADPRKNSTNESGQKDKQVPTVTLTDSPETVITKKYRLRSVDNINVDLAVDTNSAVNNASTSSQKYVDVFVSGNPSKEDDEKWQTVISKRSRKQPSQANKRPAPIKGTNQQGGLLEAAQKIHWFFVSGLSRKTEVADITTYLKSNGIEEDFLCDKMSTKSRQVSSFKLGVPKEIKDRMLEPEF